MMSVLLNSQLYGRTVLYLRLIILFGKSLTFITIVLLLATEDSEQESKRNKASGEEDSHSKKRSKKSASGPNGKKSANGANGVSVLDSAAPTSTSAAPSAGGGSGGGRGRGRPKRDEESEFIALLEEMANGDADIEEESRRREEAEFSRWLTRKRPDDWLLEAPSDLDDSRDREEQTLPPASAHAEPADELVAPVAEVCRKAVASPSIESLSSLPSLPSSALSTPPTTPLASHKAAGWLFTLCHSIHSYNTYYNNVNKPSKQLTW